MPTKRTPFIVNRSSIFFLFILGLLSFTQVNIIGYLGISEIMFAFLSPYYLFKYWNKIKNSQLFIFLILIIGWFLSAIVTDYYRENTIDNSLKGAATPILWGSAFISIYILLIKNGIYNAKWFFLGATLSSVISIYYFKPGSLIGLEQMGDGSGTGDLDFRVHLVGVMTNFSLALSLFIYPKKNTLLLLLFFAFGIICFINGSRNAGLVLIMTVFLTPYIKKLWYDQNLTARNKNSSKSVFAIILFLLSALVVKETYEHAAFSGWLGEFEKNRYIEQSNTTVGILGGRSEFAAAIYAILDTPIIGHGSWAKDTEGYRYMGARLLGQDLSKLPKEILDSNIPGHSHLWGPWVAHGFLGFVFWLYVLIFILRFLWKNGSYALPYLPFTILFSLQAIWNILFSPVGFRPVEVAGYVFLIILSESARHFQRKQIAPIFKESSVFSPMNSPELKK